MNILLKFWQKGKDGATLRQSSDPQEMHRVLGRAEFEKAYLKVTYGKMVNVWGDTVDVYNHGRYTSKRKARKALKAFVQEGEEDK